MKIFSKFVYFIVVCPFSLSLAFEYDFSLISSMTQFKSERFLFLYILRYQIRIRDLCCWKKKSNLKWKIMENAKPNQRDEMEMEKKAMENEKKWWKKHRQLNDIWTFQFSSCKTCCSSQAISNICWNAKEFEQIIIYSQTNTSRNESDSKRKR